MYNRTMNPLLPEKFQEKYGLQLQGLWEFSTLFLLEGACADMSRAFGDHNPGWMKRIHICIEAGPYGGLTSSKMKIKLNPLGLTRWTIVHELAHAWDYSSLCTNSFRMMLITNSWGPVPGLHQVHPLDQRYWYHPGEMPVPCGVDEHFNRYEDFAESVTAFVYPEQAALRAAKNGRPYDRYGYSHFHDTPRGRFIRELIKR